MVMCYASYVVNEWFRCQVALAITSSAFGGISNSFNHII